jgi:hypothetical protein
MIVNYYHTVITIVNYNRKTFIVQATKQFFSSFSWKPKYDFVFKGSIFAETCFPQTETGNQTCKIFYGRNLQVREPLL